MTEDANAAALVEAKAAMRTAGYERRRAVRDPSREALANEHLLEHVASRTPDVVSAYMAIRSEIDPRPTMDELISRGVEVCVPVIVGRGEPLEFRRWTPDAIMVPGPFGALVPANEPVLVPDVVITPLIAFDRCGRRLGYGGGFYDRTLTGLRHRGRVHAAGFAYAGQEVDEVPTGSADVALDAVVTESGVRSLPVVEE